ncbi:hypothetical protein ACFL5G_04105 [Candidatus Margulisiibacteriota bacterium]
MRKALLPLIFLLIITSFLINGCGRTAPTDDDGGGGGGGGGYPYTYLGSQNPGDLVNWTMNADGTLSFENEDTGAIMTANYRVSQNTLSSGTIYHYEAYDIVLNGSPIADKVPFAELPNHALVAYIPSESGTNELAFFTASPISTVAGMAGEYNFIDVVTDNTVAYGTSSVKWGTYNITSAALDTTANYVSPNTFSDAQAGVGLSMDSGYAATAGDLHLAVGSTGVLVADRGVNKGMRIGSKIPAASAQNILGVYIIFTPDGQILGRGSLTGTGPYNCAYSFSDGTSGDFDFSEESPGMYGGVDITAGNATMRIKCLGNNTFLAIRYDNSTGKYNNFIGVRQEE